MKLFRQIILLIAVTNTFAQHNEYHVSVANGNDTNMGSASQPFKSISAAAKKALPGDVITVHAGIYREEITPPRGGNSDNERIVYQAAPGEDVTITGSEPMKGWKHLSEDTWEVKIPNSFFGNFNPYSLQISGDWFTPIPKNRIYHRGAVYLNGAWLVEAANKNEVMGTVTNASKQLWWTESDSSFTTIWAQFKGVDPNKENVEINVRRTVFYPDRPFINYLTIRGFKMQNASTNWAPPTAEQEGLIGTHWSKGWIIENNTIKYSKCSGIALGKYGDKFDNSNTESATGYMGTIERALAFGWNKGTVGGHIVRNNHIAFCEQTGIVGSMGCAFSVIENNTIHDIYKQQIFTGAELAGIKFHGAVDVQIIHNNIYNTILGIWLDWMAQGTQVKDNLLHDNFGQDILIEVQHGPTLVSNNIFLSKLNLWLSSRGVVFAHNIFAGGMRVFSYDTRETPYLLPHSTFVAGMHDNPDGDVQFYNNLFVNGGDATQYSKALWPVVFDGNVYTKGSIGPTKADTKKSLGVIEEGKQVSEKMKKYSEHLAIERNAILDTMFDANAKLIQEADGTYFTIAMDKNWLKQNRKLVSTEILTNAMVSNLPFENPDGSKLVIDRDFFGKKRNTKNPSPGPFEITGSKEVKIKVF